MGLFDKIKNFANGDKMATVEVTAINGGAPTGVRFAISDGRIEGSMRVTANQACTMLAMVYELVVKTEKEGSWTTYAIASVKDPGVQELKAGAIIERDFTIEGIELIPYLARNGFDDVNDAVGNGKVKVAVRCVADVKGSPFDPTGEAELTLTPSTLPPASIAITVIEGQPATYASFPVTDSVLKGTVVVTANDPCTLTATKYEIRLQLDTAAGPRDVLVKQNQTPELNPNPFSVSFGGTNIEFPHKMKRGAKATQTWMVSDIDLSAALAQHGFGDARQAASDPRVKLVVKTIAQVQGGGDIATSEVQVALT